MPTHSKLNWLLFASAINVEGLPLLVELDYNIKVETNIFVYIYIHKYHVV